MLNPHRKPVLIFACFTSTDAQILTAGVHRLCLDISDDSVHDSLDASMSLTRTIALESPSKLSLSTSEKEELLAQAEEQRAFLLRRCRRMLTYAAEERMLTYAAEEHADVC